MGISCVEQGKGVWRKNENQQNDDRVNMKVGVHDDRNEHCVGGGYRLDPVRVIYVMQLGLPEGVRIVGIFSGKNQ